MKVAVVYWSGTGNTEAMAQAVLAGAAEKGAEATLFTPGDFGPEMVTDYDGIAFGCPAMGAEVLEEDEFQPMFTACEGNLKGRKIGLFGSYGWGDGEWMRSWEDTCDSCGALRTGDSVICCDAPDEEALAACKALGAALA